MSDGGFPTEFRRKHGKKILVGGGSTAALGLVIWQVIWPAITDLRAAIKEVSVRTEVLQAITQQLRDLEKRADGNDSAHRAIWDRLNTLEQSRDYQQGLLDGLGKTTAPRVQWITKYGVDTVDGLGYLRMTNLWHELTNRNFRMSQLRTPDGEINVWYQEQTKGNE